MQLTAKELKTIEHLKKQQRRWPIARLLGLASVVLFGIVCLSTLLFGIHKAQEFWRLSDSLLMDIGQRQPQEGIKLLANFFPVLRDNVLMCAVEFSIWLLLASIWFFMLATLIANWRGNVDRKLLLKLFEEQQEQAQKQDGRAV